MKHEVAEPKTSDPRDSQHKQPQDQADVPHQHHSGESREIRDQQGNLIDPKDNCNIYVAGIPKRTTEDHLRKTFSPFGTILYVHIIKDHETKMPRGFAYILFKSGKDANTAIREMD